MIIIKVFIIKPQKKRLYSNDIMILVTINYNHNYIDNMKMMRIMIVNENTYKNNDNFSANIGNGNNSINENIF